MELLWRLLLEAEWRPLFPPAVHMVVLDVWVRVAVVVAEDADEAEEEEAAEAVLLVLCTAGMAVLLLL